MLFRLNVIGRALVRVPEVSTSTVRYGSGVRCAGRCVLAIFLLLYTSIVLEFQEWQGLPGLLEAIIAAGVSLPWLASDRRPGIAAGVTIAVSALQAGLGIGVVPGNLTVLYLVHVLAARGRRRDARLVAVTAVLLLLLGTALHGDSWSLLLPVGAGCAAVAAATLSGVNARLRAEHEQGLLNRAEQLGREQDHLAQLAAAQERTRIARDLHDVVSHSLAGVLALNEGILRTSPHLHDDDRATLTLISGSCRHSLGELRRLLQVLRDEVPEEPASTDVDALRGALTGLRASGIAADLVVEGESRWLPPAVHETLLRILQEATTNVLKHAVDATRVDVTMSFLDDAVTLDIADDGRGAADSAPHERGATRTEVTGGGFGLTGMRERVNGLEGSMCCGVRQSGGFEISVRLPTRSPAPPARSRTDGVPERGRPGRAALVGASVSHGGDTA